MGRKSIAGPMGTLFPEKHKHPGGGKDHVCSAGPEFSLVNKGYLDDQYASTELDDDRCLNKTFSQHHRFDAAAASPIRPSLGRDVAY